MCERTVKSWKSDQIEKLHALAWFSMVIFAAAAAAWAQGFPLPFMCPYLIAIFQWGETLQLFNSSNYWMAFILPIFFFPLRCLFVVSIANTPINLYRLDVKFTLHIESILLKHFSKLPTLQFYFEAAALFVYLEKKKWQ